VNPSTFYGSGLSGLGDRGRISNLGLDAVDVNGTDDDVGGLVGLNYGCIADSYSTGSVTGGRGYVGGLVGSNDGSITTSYSTATVSGNGSVGGLVGLNWDSIGTSYSAGMVTGGGQVGGLVGANDGSITTSYSTATVSGHGSVGGLVGVNWDSIATSYSAGSVTGIEDIGGLVGSGSSLNVRDCVWNVEVSGLSGSTGGMGLTSGEMMDSYMLGLNGFANDPNWMLDDGRDYPRLAWEGTVGRVIPEPDIDWLEGNGTEGHPYRIETADQLMLLAETPILLDRHFVLCADIDLDPNLPDGRLFDRAVIPQFFDVLDGNDYTISNLTIKGDSCLGLFGRLFGKVKSLGVENVSVTGSGNFVGSLVGCSYDGSVITGWSTGTVSGDAYVGGLAGSNRANITGSYSSAAVSGNGPIGGLVGENGSKGSINTSYSTGAVSGDDYVGGLVGVNYGNIAASFCTGRIEGAGNVGGLVGWNNGSIIRSYSTGMVSGENIVGGLVASNSGDVAMSYSTGTVVGSRRVGGFVGSNSYKPSSKPAGTSSTRRKMAPKTSGGFSKGRTIRVCGGRQPPRM